MFFPLVALTSAIYLLSCMVVSYRRLSCFRGPFLACISDVWLIIQTLRWRTHDAQVEALRRYGSPARIGPNLLVTDDPELLKHMSAIRSQWARSKWYSGFEFGGKTPHIFAERNEMRHRELRAKVGNGYSGKGVDNIEQCLDDQLQKTMQLLRKNYSSRGKHADMTLVVQYFTLDVLSSIAFGKTFGFIDADADQWDFLETNQKFFPILELITNNSIICSIVHSPIVRHFIAPKGTDSIGQGRIMRFAEQAIAERFRPDAKDLKDMLGSFKAHGLSEKECVSESLIQIIAGSDSTSGILRSIMLYIVSTPRIYNKLQREVDEAVANGAIAGAVVSDLEARSLPYLQAVIYEGLRKTPPLFGLQSKVAPPGGETVNGTYFPGGCEVAICDHALTHRKDIFGEDVDVFRPERWLEAEPAMRAKFEQTVGMIFGSGRYGCLGKGIAFLELNKVFFEFLRNFDFQLANPLRPVERHTGHGIWLQRGMYVVVTDRSGP